MPRRSGRPRAAEGVETTSSKGSNTYRSLESRWHLRRCAPPETTKHTFAKRSFCFMCEMVLYSNTEPLVFYLPGVNFSEIVKSCACFGVSKLQAHCYRSSDFVAYAVDKYFVLDNYYDVCRLIVYMRIKRSKICDIYCFMLR